MASAYLPTVFLSICSRFAVGSNGVPYHRLTTGGGACQKWQLGVFANGCYLAIALGSRAGFASADWPWRKYSRSTSRTILWSSPGVIRKR